MLSAEARARYARHLTLAEIGEAGQERLLASSVAVVGAGGLGSPAMLYLAAAGVGRIGIFDDDVVDRSNLQRQIVHSDAAVGRRKVDVAAERLAALDPSIRVDRHPLRLGADNALDLLAPYDVIVDGCDNFPTRYLVDGAAELLGRPLVYGSIERFEGQVSVFHWQGGPGYRDLYPQPPPPGAAPACGEAGVLGVLPGVIGTLQATEALKLLLGIGTTLSGRLLLYDALQMRFREVAFRRDPQRAPIQALVDLPATCGGPTMAPFEQIDVTTAKQRLDDGWSPYVLDVRGASEAEIATLDFTDRLVPHTHVASVVAELPRDRDILVYCRSGGRSAMACQVLAQHGFTSLFNLAGGINDWAVKVDPRLSTY